MAKRLLLVLLVAVLLLSAVSCNVMVDDTEGATTTGFAFVDKLAKQDYKGAYDYVYCLTSDVQSRDEFVERFTNIYKALQVTDVTLVDRNVEPKKDEDAGFTLTYTLKMDSDLLGTKNYQYTADIVSGPLGYAVIYMPNLILPTLEEGDAVRSTRRYGQRGEIFSADGKLLAQNSFAESVYLDLDMQPDIEQVKQMMDHVFAMDTEDIQKKYDNAIEKEFPTVVLKTLPRDTLSGEEMDELQTVHGLLVDNQKMTPARYYPLSDNAAHTIGYLGSPSEEQLAADETLTEHSQVGQAGLELAFEETMRGVDGDIIYIENDRGEEKEILYEEPTSNGADLHLTLDTIHQNTAYTLLATNLKEGQSGAIITMDYTNGDVKSMVSYPSFDNNLFNFPMDPDIYEYYTDPDNQTPLFSRTTQALYMPGSTFKPFTAVPMFEEGVMTEHSQPPIAVQNNEWYPAFSGWQHDKITRVKIPAGQPFDFEHSMKSSDNIFFAYYGIMLEDKMEPALRKMGIGEAPEFELPVTPSSLMNEDSTFDIGMRARTAYGMGELHITPLQMATMYTAFMNEGDMLNPTLLDRVTRTEEFEETVEYEQERSVFKTGTMRQSTIDKILPALRRVVVDGTAYTGGMQDIAGLVAKTGTAQIGAGSDLLEVNWVVAMDRNPDNPMIYLVVVETEEGEGTDLKLTLLNGLVRTESYADALAGKMGTPTQTGEGADATGELTEQGEPDQDLDDLEDVRPAPTDPPDEQPQPTPPPDNPDPPPIEEEGSEQS